MRQALCKLPRASTFSTEGTPRKVAIRQSHFKKKKVYWNKEKNNNGIVNSDNNFSRNGLFYVFKHQNRLVNKAEDGGIGKDLDQR